MAGLGWATVWLWREHPGAAAGKLSLLTGAVAVGVVVAFWKVLRAKPGEPEGLLLASHEARGLWDARLEALVVDSILAGEYDSELPSRVAALGWNGHGAVSVLVGTAPRMLDVDQLRRLAEVTLG